MPKTHDNSPWGSSTMIPDAARVCIAKVASALKAVEIQKGIIHLLSSCSVRVI